MGEEFGFVEVVGEHAVVVKGDTVNDGDEQQRPVGTAFGDIDSSAVVNREEDMGRVAEVWKS